VRWDIWFPHFNACFWFCLSSFNDFLCLWKLMREKREVSFCFACLLIRETMFQRCGLLVYKAVSTTVLSYIPVKKHETEYSLHRKKALPLVNSLLTLPSISTTAYLLLPKPNYIVPKPLLYVDIITTSEQIYP
jgi:hypothetical protein